MYTTDTFISSLDGELIDQGNGIYTPRTENGSFLKYEYANDVWTVTDKQGTEYAFGTTTQARQDNPNDATQIFSWMLETVTDTNSNTISYSYFKDQGQIYPDTISYNQEGLFDVVFRRAARTTPSTSYASAFKVTTGYVINKVEVSTDNSVTATYDISTDNNLVKDIIVTGFEGSSSFELPPVEFGYGNTSTSFIKDPDFAIPSYESSIGRIIGFDYSRQDHMFVDVNGDGLLDFISSPNASSHGIVDSDGEYYSYIGAWINDGTSFIKDPDFAIPSYESSIGRIIGFDYSRQDHMFVDVNGDGLLDFISSPNASSYGIVDSDGEYYSYIGAWINDGTSFETQKITNSQGGTVNVEYTAIRDFIDLNGVGLNTAIPQGYIPRVVKSITTDDNNGNTATTSYEYRDADYYYNTPYDKKFAGFGSVIKTNADGSKETTKYHQANGEQGNEPADSYSKIGKVYEQTIEDSSGDLFTRTRTNYTETALGNDAHSIQTKSQLSMQYDGTGSSVDTATGYDYDAYGNTLKHIQYGKVDGDTDGTFTDTGSDKRSIEYTYTNDTANYIVGLPTNQTLKNNSGTKEAETNYNYDIKGNLLTESKWISGSDYSDTVYTYGEFGLPLAETDALNNTTTYNYDAQNMYPASISNALSQLTTYLYDYSSGRVTQTTDPNGKVTLYDYDGLDRLIKIAGTVGNDRVQTLKYIIYNTTANPQYTKETTYRAEKVSQEIYSYIDGFGKTIQTKSEMDSGWLTLDTIYDEMGRVEKQSLPYETSSSSYSSPTSENNLLTSFVYDVLGRVLSTSNAKGTTATYYDGFETSITDAENNQKDLITDAFGNLIAVKEYNDGSVYETEYDYNAQNLLTKITDAESNVRNIDYDGLGRRTLLEDLHGSSDTTFGTWNFSYDDINLTSQTDPKGTVTSYVYDDLNRVLTEDNTSTTGIDVSYTYDSCINGIGQVCTVTTPDVNTEYSYLKQGLVDAEARVIDASSYVTSTDYDRQGNVTKTTYPNDSFTKYTYNTRGLVNRMFHNGMPIAMVDYGVHGRPTSYTHANGVSSTLSYDENELYELTNKTTSSRSTRFQDLSYSYDNVGNITQIIDASNTDTAKTQSFTYDDLYRLTGTNVTDAIDDQNYSRSYAYSSIGNITAFDGVSYLYDDAGYSNPHAVTKVGEIGYSYDNNGNLINDGVWTHSWDYRNRLTSSTDGSITSSYEYDNDNIRTKLVEGSDITIYPTSSYEVLNGNPKISMSIGETLVATDDNGTINHVHTDHLGGTNITTDADGAITQILDYYPYGDTRIDTGTDNETKQFTGYTKDAGTGLNYAGARYYAADNGRFISQDPVALSIGDWNTLKNKTQDGVTNYLSYPQRHNTYSYAFNNPVMYEDTNGEWGALVAAVLGGVLLSPTYVGEGELSGQQTEPIDRFIYNKATGGEYDSLGTGSQAAVGLVIGIGSINPKKAVDDVADLSLVGINAARKEFTQALTKIGNRKISNDIIDHVADSHLSQFAKIGIEGKDAVQKHINDVLDNPTGVVDSINGKKYFYNDSTVVVSNPNSLGNKGSAFPNKNPKAYVERAVKRETQS